MFSQIEKFLQIPKEGFYVFMSCIQPHLKQLYRFLFILVGLLSFVQTVGWQVLYLHQLCDDIFHGLFPDLQDRFQTLPAVVLIEKLFHHGTDTQTIILIITVINYPFMHPRHYLFLIGWV